MSCAGHVTSTGNKRNAYTVLVEKFEAGTTWKNRRSWKANTKKNHKEMGLDYVGWIRVTQSRERWWAVTNTAKNLRVP